MNCNKPGPTNYELEKCKSPPNLRVKIKPQHGSWTPLMQYRLFFLYHKKINLPSFL